MWRWSENLETQSFQDSSRAILSLYTAEYYYLIQTRGVFHINYRSSPNFVFLCVFLMFQLIIMALSAPASRVNGYCWVIFVALRIALNLVRLCFNYEYYNTCCKSLNHRCQTKQYQQLDHFNFESIFLINEREGIRNVDIELVKIQVEFVGSFYFLFSSESFQLL
ncbi:Hypothetical_protein [Hexamita inflata]|uniref:Hypothetical_protein n=1 Tax=Hexamita inflata TaxID=28002 RepID=A0ABP1GXK7_9EUKA